MSAPEESSLLSDARRNMSVELTRFDDIKAQWDWLIEHLGVYLHRLAGFCEHLNKPPSAFLQTSLFCNIQVASAQIENIMRDQGRGDDSWTALIESIEVLPNAESMTECVSRFETFRQTIDS